MGVDGRSSLYRELSPVELDRQVQRLVRRRRKQRPLSPGTCAPLYGVAELREGNERSEASDVPPSHQRLTALLQSPTAAQH